MVREAALVLEVDSHTEETLQRLPVLSLRSEEPGRDGFVEVLIDAVGINAVGHRRAQKEIELNSEWTRGKIAGLYRRGNSSSVLSCIPLYLRRWLDCEREIGVDA